MLPAANSGHMGLHQTAEFRSNTSPVRVNQKRQYSETAIQHNAVEKSRSNSTSTELVKKHWIMEDEVCKLIFNNPKQRNALSLDMLSALKSALKECVETKSTRAIILTAEPPVFSSGHNLKEMTSKDGLTHHAKIFSACTEVMNLVQDMQIPVICSVQGVAAAAGCQLVASCDIVVAGESAQFSTPGAKAGLFCSTPGIALARSVPRKIALDMLLTARTISSSEALLAGLVSRVVPDPRVDAETLKGVRHILLSTLVEAI